MQDWKVRLAETSNEVTHLHLWESNDTGLAAVAIPQPAEQTRFDLLSLDLWQLHCWSLVYWIGTGTPQLQELSSLPRKSLRTLQVQEDWSKAVFLTVSQSQFNFVELAAESRNVLQMHCWILISVHEPVEVFWRMVTLLSIRESVTMLSEVSLTLNLGTLHFDETLYKQAWPLLRVLSRRHCESDWSSIIIY